MRLRHWFLSLPLVAISVMFNPGTVGQAVNAPSQAPDGIAAARQLAQLPTAFTKNEGQWDERVLYRTMAGGATIWFTREGITYQFIRRLHPKGVDLNDRKEGTRGALPPTAVVEDSVETAIVVARLLDPDPSVRIEAEESLDYACNYFFGKDPSKWIANVPNYGVVKYTGIYPGVDLIFSSDSKGLTLSEVSSSRPLHDQVRFRYEGHISGHPREDFPVTDLGRGRFRAELPWVDSVLQARTSERIVSKTVSPYGAASSIGLVYSTYLGGSNDDWGTAIATDAEGNAYVAGYTLSLDYPTTGHLDSVHNGGVQDIVVTKVLAEGNMLEYSTYLGGSSTEYCSAIEVDGSGSAFITGLTGSPDYPTVNAFDSLLNGDNDVIVTKIHPSGSALEFSTFIGGAALDHGDAIAINGSGESYLTGFTYSSDFPTLSAFDNTLNGNSDAFVTKLAADGTSLLFSTFLGGHLYEDGTAIAVNDAGCVTITGETQSNDFPIVYALDPSYNGGFYDVFIAKLAPAGDSIEFSTFLGGAGSDYAHGLALDAEGNIYVTGSTGSIDFPTSFAYDSTQNGNTDVFVTKLAEDGSEIRYSTFLGGSGGDEGRSIAVSKLGKAHIVGDTWSQDLPATAAIEQIFSGGGRDAFVAVLGQSGRDLQFCTYFGGTGFEVGLGIHLDLQGATYITGYTDSPDIPSLSAFDSTANGGDDPFVAKLDTQGLNSYCADVQSLFCDDFEFGASDRWQSLVGSQEGECEWQAVNGTYRTSLVGIEQLCLRSVVDTPWTDYIYEVDLRGISGVDKEVTFRSQDGLNTYDVNLVGTPFNQILLNKVVNGVSSILASAPLSSGPGEWYHLRISCLGPSLDVTVNAVPVIEFIDDQSPFLFGGIGLVCWTGATGSCSIEFDNILVESQTAACDCPFTSDIDANGLIDAVDLAIEIDVVFFGGEDIQDPVCPATRADFNSNGIAEAVDLAFLIDHVFFGGPNPADPCVP